MNVVNHNDRSAIVKMAKEGNRRFAARPGCPGELIALTQKGADAAGLNWSELRTPYVVLHSEHQLAMVVGSTEHRTSCVLDEILKMGEHPRQGLPLIPDSVASGEVVGALHLGAAVKHDLSKARMGLIDPAFAEEIAHVLTFGEIKYKTEDGSSNWRVSPGLGVDRVLDAAERHIAALRRGEDLDPETGRSHAAHAACCLQFAHHYINNPGVFNDDRRWKSYPEQK